MKNILFIILFSVLNVIKLNARNNVQDSIAMVNTWEQFKKSFAAKDLKILKALTAAFIYCSDCYDNSSAETERHEY